MSSEQSGQNITAGLRIAVLGAGKMGGILLQAFLRSGLFTAEQIAATVAHDLRAEALTKQFGLPVTTDSRRAVEGADIVLLAVKPTQVVQLVREVSSSLKPHA
jgi:pyrroline-5-carboxylate reductase